MPASAVIKRPNMPEEEALEEQVKQWLRKQGYPLEMRVAAALRNAGFAVMQSAYFVDTSSAKPRELDVVAHRTWSSENIDWQLILLIECKMAKNQPWVLFTRALETNDTEGQFQYYRTRASKLGRHLLTQLRRRTGAPADLRLLGFNDRPGYGLQRATLGAKADTQNDNARDVAFDAATKISHAAVLEAKAVDLEEHADTPIGRIVLSVIAIDGQLFDAHLGETQEVIVSPSVLAAQYSELIEPLCRVMYRYVPGAATVYILTIVTVASSLLHK